MKQLIINLLHKYQGDTKLVCKEIWHERNTCSLSVFADCIADCIKQYEKEASTSVSDDGELDEETLEELHMMMTWEDEYEQVHYYGNE